jgi:hypothetical protein
MPVFSGCPIVSYAHLLPRNIAGPLQTTYRSFPRLCLSTLGFHVVINKQSCHFFKLPENIRKLISFFKELQTKWFWNRVDFTGSCGLI